MAQPFSLSRTLHSDGWDPEWPSQIRARTGSEEETESILRTLDRFGGDAGIQRYDVAPVPVRRGQRAGKSVTWTVRAVRFPPREASPTTVPFGGGR